MLGLLLGILVSAMDNTIVATAMPTIIADLGGLDRFVWVTAAYMVTEMAGMPIFGKLSDIYGRKRFFMFGLVVFLIGSMLSGTAQNITELIIYRAIQGIGGGALAPIAFTIIFDVVSPEQRGKIGGLFGAVFGLSSIFGPLLGAYITQYLSWRWIFYVNLPIGIAAFLFILLGYRESYIRLQESIDWFGVITMVPAVGMLMFALQLGGTSYAWNSPIIIGLFVLAAIFLLAFLWIEARVKEPIITYSMFRNRLYTGSNLVALFSSSAYVVAVLFIPLFIQGVMGGNATNSGLILLPMMLASVVASQVGAMLVMKISYRTVMLASGILFILGIYLLTTITPETTHMTITMEMIITGLGIGASFSVLSMGAMQSFDASKRASASSTMNFVRELAMAVGITIYGTIQKNDFSSQIQKAFSGVTIPASFLHMDPRAILSPALRAHVPSFIMMKLSNALAYSISHIFAWTLIPAALALVFTFVLTKEKMAAQWGQAKNSSIQIDQLIDR